ncbi:MAG: transporter substrate-binding domain-containing protein [Lachnospiraceae bacterium]|nr:transporter substrate-binding domain-containing protein [Lachnospiraceae bacterium]
MSGSSQNTRKPIYVTIVILILIVILFALFLIFRVPSVFFKDPVVENTALNTFDETLYVVTDKDYEPFSYIGEKGQLLGYDVELINEVANRLNKNLKLELLDWNEACEKIYSGRADIILNMETDTASLDEDIISTIPTIEKQYVVYGRDKASSVMDLYGKRVASMHNLNELGLNKFVTYVDSYDSMFKSLARGEYDYIVCPIQVGSVFLERMNLKNIKVGYAVKHVYGAMALSPEKKELRDDINKVLHELYSEGYIKHLDSKWITNRYFSMTPMDLMEHYPSIFLALVVAVILFCVMITIVFLTRRTSRLRASYMKQLEAEKEQAELSSRAKTAFLTNMTHDLRTPMNAVIGYTSLALRNACPPDELRNYLRNIESAARNLLELINNVLEMSRIESGSIELENEKTDLSRVINDICNLYEPQMTEKNIDFKSDYTSVKDLFVLCDKNKLMKIILNLLNNAYKFTPKGGSVELILSETEEFDPSDKKRHYELRCKDNGIGMTDEFSKKIFDPFERERTSTETGLQGTGLGMSITKSFIDLMGGQVTVITEKEKGTEFIIKLTFELPTDETVSNISKNGVQGQELNTSDVSMDSSQIKNVTKKHEPNESVEASLEGSLQEPSSNPSSPDSLDGKDEKASDKASSPSQKRVLLVEDNEINREIAIAVLEDFDFLVEYAVNGKEGVEMIEKSGQGYYDAVLMDIQMPIMDGYEAARTIRTLSDPKLSGIPIIALTANSFPEDKKKAKEAGMNAHIGKPFDTRLLIETILSLTD